MNKPKFIDYNGLEKETFEILKRKNTFCKYW